MPDDVSKSPFSDELLPPTEQGILVGFQRQLLRPISELRALREIHGVPNCYHDPVFTANRKICRLCGEVCPKRLGALCSKVSERVRVFFVRKKDGNLRLIVDCRRTNQMFFDPPGVDILTGDRFSQIEVSNEGFLGGDSCFQEATAVSARWM